MIKGKTVTVSDASTELIFNVGAEAVNYYGSGGSAGSNFNVDVRNVTIGDSTGRFEVRTTDNISINGISGSDDSNVSGTLVFTGNVINIAGGVTFNTAGVELNNSSNMNIGGIFSVQQSLTITGPVTLTADAQLTSVTGDLGLTGTVTGGGNDLTMTATSGTVTTGTFNNIGALTINANAVNISNNINATSVAVTGTTTLSGTPTVNSSGAITFNSPVTVDTGANAKLVGSSVDLNSTVSGAGNLTIQVTGNGASDGSLGEIDMTGTLTLADGIFTAGDTITAGVINIASDAQLAMGSFALTSNGNLTNAGTLTSTGTVTVNGNVTNSSGATMTVDTLALDNTANLSLLDLDGNVTISTLELADDKSAKLTRGNITVADFNFLGSNSNSTFELASGTSLEVTNSIAYNLSSPYYTGNYFITSGGGKLIQTVAASDVDYRVGNSNSAIVVTLRQTAGSSGERIAVGVVDSVKEQGYTVSGIEDTVKFTINIDRDGGTSNLYMGVNWDSTPGMQEGSGFDSDNASLFDYSGGKWTEDGSITTITTPSANRHAFTNYELIHNGTYTIANSGADMTSPPNPMNVNIYEMANSHFLSFNENLDTNIFLPFEIGVYPYFKPDTYATAESLDQLGKAIYRQMEYRFVTDPQTNPLYGQVPPIGAETGQAITEQGKPDANW